MRNFCKIQFARLESQQSLSHSSLKSAYNVSRRGESNNKKTAEGAKNTDDTD